MREALRAQDGRYWSYICTDPGCCPPEGSSTRRRTPSPGSTRTRSWHPASGSQAEQAEQHGIGDATLEQLRADVVRLSRQSDTGEPFAVFLDMRRVRERIYRLLDRRLWPGEQSDLYFLLGILNGLMGVAADRLGYPESAEELMRAGWAYAVAIDHRPLLAALRQQQSYVATWHGRPRQGRDLAADGLRYVSAGQTAANLHIKYASASARLGDVEDARRAVTAAHDARQRENVDDLLAIGGEFPGGDGQLFAATAAYMPIFFRSPLLGFASGATGEPGPGPGPRG